MSRYVKCENGYTFQNDNWKPNYNSLSNYQDDLNRSLYRSVNKEDYYIVGYDNRYLKGFIENKEIVQYHSYSDSRFAFKLNRIIEKGVYLQPRKGDKLRRLDFYSNVVELENEIISNNGDRIRYIVGFDNIRLKSSDSENGLYGDQLNLNHLEQLKEGLIFDGSEVVNKSFGNKAFPYLGALHNTDEPVYVKIAMFLNDSDKKIGLDSIYQYVDPLLFLGYYDPQKYERGVLVANQTNDFIDYYINNVYSKEKEAKKASNFLTQFLMFGPSKGVPIKPLEGLEPPKPEPIPEPEAVPVTGDSLPMPVQTEEPEPEPLESGDSLPEPIENDPAPAPIVITPRPQPTQTPQTQDTPCPTVVQISDFLIKKLQPWVDWQKERFKDVNDAINKVLEVLENRLVVLTDKINQIKIDCPNPCADNQNELMKIQDEIRKINELIRDILSNAKPQIPPEPEPEVIAEKKEDEKGFFASIWEYFKNPSLWTAILLFLLLLGLLFTAMAVKRKIRKDPVDYHNEAYR